MLLLMKQKRCTQLPQVPRKLTSFLDVVFKSTSQAHLDSELQINVNRVTKAINDHPFPNQPLEPVLLQLIPPSVFSTSFVENVLGRLFATHSNGLKAYEFFKISLNHDQFYPSSDAFEKTLHILTRMRYFDKGWELMEEIQRKHPSLLTLKSMSIMLSRIAKFLSYEDTLKAFKKFEDVIFVGRKFGTEEFNVLIRAFCTQRQMKEARSVFHKLHSQFPPDTKTMNILLLGFKESGDITSVELFYHDMVRRGFKPNSITYNIRIDAYCKKGRLGDGLRLFEEMENLGCPPTVETITTLIHGAGIARNIFKARELFAEISQRNLQPDAGVYNALMSSFIQSRDVKSAIELMDEMEKTCVGHDDMTYHTMFIGLIKSSDIEGVCELCHMMTARNFVPKTRTVVMLMKFFCQSHQVDMGLSFWRYLVEKGYCPHGHALDLLVMGLCSRGRVQEAFECSKQTLERGRHISEGVFRMLERFLLQDNETDKLKTLEQMSKQLGRVLPPSTERTIYISSSSGTK